MTAPRSAADLSKADLVHRRLKEEIELGELAPGVPLSELSLVERTGASRTPVREALRRLAAEGLVDLTPRLGARVSRVSAQSVRDLFEFRQLIDEVKGVPLAQGFDEVFYPGEVEDRAEATNLAAGGVVLAEQSLTDLRVLAAEAGVPFPEEAA